MDSIYTQDDTPKILSPEEFLLKVDESIQRILPSLKAGESNESEELWSVILDLSMLCFEQGILGVGEGEQADRELEAIRSGHCKWMTLVQYTKDTYDIEFHPLTMLMVIQNAFDGQPGYERLVECVGTIFKEVVGQATDDVKDVEIVEVREEERFNGTFDEMLAECFRLLGNLGTFHRDREKYTNDEDRHTHDLIVDLFHRMETMVPKEIQTKEKATNEAST